MGIVVLMVCIPVLRGVCVCIGEGDGFTHVSNHTVITGREEPTCHIFLIHVLVCTTFLAKIV